MTELDEILKNIKIMKECSDNIVAKLISENNPKLREQALREYLPLKQIVDTFGELIDSEDFKNLAKENENGSEC
jgi:hypothetical protein